MEGAGSIRIQVEGVVVGGHTSVEGAGVTCKGALAEVTHSIG